jgi:hypothetical protein
MTRQQVGFMSYLSEPLYLEDISAFLVKTKQALIGVQKENITSHYPALGLFKIIS